MAKEKSISSVYRSPRNTQPGNKFSCEQSMACLTDSVNDLPLRLHYAMARRLPGIIVRVTSVGRGQISVPWPGVRLALCARTLSVNAWWPTSRNQRFSANARRILSLRTIQMTPIYVLLDSRSSNLQSQVFSAVLPSYGLRVDYGVGSMHLVNWDRIGSRNYGVSATVVYALYAG